MMSEPKQLILGANSFLAANLASDLSKTGNSNLTGLIRESDNRVHRSLYRKIYNNLTELFQVEKAFDIIYLIGAFVPLHKAEQPDQRYVADNIELVLKISTQYPDARIVFVSSVAVYGQPLHLPLTEQSPFNMPGLYGLSKIAGEAIIRNHASYAIIRFSSIWGPGMNPETFVPRVIQQAKDGCITLWGQGGRLQNYIHVQDAALFCMAAAKMEKNEVLLGVYPRSYSNKDIAAVVATKLSADITFQHEDNGASFVYDATATYKNTGFTPDMGILENIGGLLA